jgi:hypothetical protein
MLLVVSVRPSGFDTPLRGYSTLGLLDHRLSRNNMNILKILQLIAVIGTIVTGLVSLLWPRSVFGFTGLTAPGSRGITEIRSILGGLFIGLGIAVFVLATREAYQMLGIMYIAIGAVRAVSMVVDKSIEQSNIVSLIVEIVFGVILVL